LLNSIAALVAMSALAIELVRVNLP